MLNSDDATSSKLQKAGEFITLYGKDFSTEKNQTKTNFSQVSKHWLRCQGLGRWKWSCLTVTVVIESCQLSQSLPLPNLQCAGIPWQKLDEGGEGEWNACHKTLSFCYLPHVQIKKKYPSPIPSFVTFLSHLNYWYRTTLQATYFHTPSLAVPITHVDL